MEMRRVRKAVFPAAGLGTRFMPATKAIPKEMLTVLDKPLIQHVVEEAAEAGIEQFIFVTSRGKGAIEDHFDRAPELERTLKDRGKDEALLAATSMIRGYGEVSYVRQMLPLGLGHAVWCARHLVGDEPFAVISPDDLVLSSTPCIAQLIEAYSETGANIVAAMDVPLQDTRKYGILDTDDASGKIVEVKGMVEKPEPETAPSTLSIIGRYVLDPSVFIALDRQEKGAGGEIQLTDAIAARIGKEGVFGLRFEGQRFDCGTKEGWLEANIAFAARDPALSAILRTALERELANG